MDQTAGSSFPLPPPPARAVPAASIGTIPVLALASLGVLAAGVLLFVYYVVVIRCCLNLHRSDAGAAAARTRRTSELSGAAADAPRGLDESAIMSIPSFRYRKPSNRTLAVVAPECAVCLCELQEEERVKLLPSCCHIFHVGCIGAWLLANANCPLCRTAVKVAGGGELVIPPEFSHEQQRRRPSMSSEGNEAVQGSEKLQSKGDECIAGAATGAEEGGEEAAATFLPSIAMRRSLSLDSSADPHLLMAMQKTVAAVAISDGSSEEDGRRWRPCRSANAADLSV